MTARSMLTLLTIAWVGLTIGAGAARIQPNEPSYANLVQRDGIPPEYVAGAFILKGKKIDGTDIKCMQGKCGEWEKFSEISKKNIKYTGCYQFRPKEKESVDREGKRGTIVVPDSKRFTCAGKEMPRAEHVAALQDGRVYVVNAEQGSTIEDSDQCMSMYRHDDNGKVEWRRTDDDKAVDDVVLTLESIGGKVVYNEVTKKFWTNTLSGCSMSAIVADKIYVGHISSSESKVMASLELDKKTTTRHQIVFPMTVPDTSHPKGLSAHIWGEASGRDLIMYVGLINGTSSFDERDFAREPTYEKWKNLHLQRASDIYVQCKKVTLRPAPPPPPPPPREDWLTEETVDRWLQDLFPTATEAPLKNYLSPNNMEKFIDQDDNWETLDDFLTEETVDRWLQDVPLDQEVEKIIDQPPRKHIVTRKMKATVATEAPLDQLRKKISKLWKWGNDRPGQ